MNTRMVAIGSCLLLSSLVACGGDDSGGGSATDAGLDAGETQAGSGAKGGSGGRSGSPGEEGGSSGHAAGSGGKAGAGGAPSETKYDVGGDVSGLSGSGLVLKLNGSDELPVSKNGSFTFDTMLASGASYAVSVGTQPKDPVQACSVAAGSGKIDMANVSNVKVTCSTATRSVGGTLTGSGNAQLTLKNGTETLDLNADGNFTFPTAIKQGDSYAVSVQTAPAGRTCTVAQGSGTVGTSNIENVAVSCYADLKLLAKARVGGALLTWANNGATSYNVYVSTDAACNWDNAGSCMGADHKDGVSTPYLWSGLEDGKAYYFQVRGMHPNEFVTRSGATGARPNRAQLNGVVNALALNQGTVYVGGTFTTIGAYTGTSVPLDTQSGLASRIPSFPIVSNTAYVVISDGNNGYFIGGEFTSIGTSTRTHLAHVLANGTIDETWKPDPNGYVSVLALSGSTLFVGGDFTMIGGQARTRLAAVSSTGAGNALAWTPTPDALVTSMVATSDTLYVGGEFNNISSTPRTRLAAYPLANNLPGAIKTDFHPDPSLPSDPAGRIIAMYAGAGKLYVSGYFSTIAGVGRPNLAAFNAASGALDTGFDADPDLQVNAFALLDNKLYVGGRFAHIGGADRTRMAALDPSTGAALADWNPSPDGEVMALAAAGGVVYAGGDFHNIGGSARTGLAALSTSGTGMATAWNPQPDGAISTITLSGETLYVLGDTRTYGAEPRPKLASFSGPTLTNWAPNVTGGDVRALALAGGNVYAGGNFTKVAGMDRVAAAAIDGNGAPTAWNAQINGGGQVFALATDATHVFAGGSFTAAGGGNRANLAALTQDTGAAASDWTSPAPDGAVRALVSDNNKLFVGGEFQNVGSTGRVRLAAFQASGALDTGWTSSADAPVNALLVVNHADVYVGGEFVLLGGSTRNRLGSLDVANGNLQTWDPNLDGAVRGLGFGHNTVFAIGDFGNVGISANPTLTPAVSRNFLAAFDASARTLETAYPNLNDVGRAVVADDNYLYLGGDFTGVKGVLCSSYFRDSM